MPKQGEVAAPNVHEFFEELRQRAAIMTSMRRVVILVETGQGYGFPARYTERPIPKYPLGIDDMTQDLPNAPLAGSITKASSLWRKLAQKLAKLRRLPGQDRGKFGFRH